MTLGPSRCRAGHRLSRSKTPPPRGADPPPRESSSPCPSLSPVLRGAAHWTVPRTGPKLYLLALFRPGGDLRGGGAFVGEGSPRGRSSGPRGPGASYPEPPGLEPQPTVQFLWRPKPKSCDLRCVHLSVSLGMPCPCGRTRLRPQAGGQGAWTQLPRASGAPL